MEVGVRITVDPHTFEQRRRQLLALVVEALEEALPPGTPARVGEGRAIWDVIADHLRVMDVREALRSLAGAPGGELTPTRAGNVAICSAESSALMAVNFLAPFAARAGLLGRPVGSIEFERELPVSGVRSPVGPTLDAVHKSAAGTLAFEAKTAEPWRAVPKVVISSQYDEPARRASARTLQALIALRGGALRYQCLDAAQLLKHLLGIHSGVDAGSLIVPVSLVVLYWRPSEPGAHADLFDLLDAEIADFAARVNDQPVSITALSTVRLLDEWSEASNPRWLSEHAMALRSRYDVPLRSVEPTAPRSRTFVEWSRRWLAVARYTGREVPDLERRLEQARSLWGEDIPPGWERPLDVRLIDRDRRFLRTPGPERPRPGSEHELEFQVLDPDPAEVHTDCLGGRLIDGISAVPLTRDKGGRRAGNVEADMLLLVEHERGHRLLLVEAKTASNNAFYAAVENLRQLKLFGASRTAQRIFEERRPGLTHPLPVTAVVLGPRSFFEARGAKERAVKPAQRLLDTVCTEFGVDARLATWDPTTRTISAWTTTADAVDPASKGTERASHIIPTRRIAGREDPPPTAAAFAMPEGPPIELELAPRLESWERHDDPSQVALRQFVAHVRERIGPLLDATPGPLAFRLDVGLPDGVDPLWERDLDNYLFPIARELPERVVSVWGTKGRGARSHVRLEPAIPATAPPGWREFRVPRAPRRERRWKGAVRHALEHAGELPEGPVALQLALTVGSSSAWPGIWKPSIDGLEPLLGRTYPDRDWNPLDGRIVRLGLHRDVDAALSGDAAMVVWARSADERWPELRWLASLDGSVREVFFEQHRAKRRRRRAGAARPDSLPARPGRRVEAGPATSGVREFKDDDDGYLSWIAANSIGFVINIQRRLNPSDAKLHRAGCVWIGGGTQRGRKLTGAYIKYCSLDLADLDVWAIDHAGGTLDRCKTCRPPSASEGTG